MQPNSDWRLHKKSLFLLPHFGPSGPFFPESAISLQREKQYVGRGGGRGFTMDQPWSCYLKTFLDSQIIFWTLEWLCTYTVPPFLRGRNDGNWEGAPRRKTAAALAGMCVTLARGFKPCPRCRHAAWWCHGFWGLPGLATQEHQPASLAGGPPFPRSLLRQVLGSPTWLQELVSITALTHLNSSPASPGAYRVYSPLEEGCVSIRAPKLRGCQYSDYNCAWSRCGGLSGTPL